MKYSEVGSALSETNIPLESQASIMDALLSLRSEKPVQETE